jgi:alanyl-tRNA synthetase
MLAERKKMEAEILNLKKTLAAGGSRSNAEAEVVNGIKFVAKVIPDVHPKELKGFIDEMSQNIGSSVMVLATDKDGKASIVVGVTKDLTSKYSAVDLVKIASAAVGGQGGRGRPDMAQAGGPDASKLPIAFEDVKKAI